jgi:hypothetical protein
MALKVHEDCIMPYLRGIAPLFLLVGLFVPSFAGAATFNYGTGANTPFQIVASAIDLRGPAADSGSQAARSGILAATGQADVPGATAQPVLPLDDAGGDSLPELGGVIRHRGFIKVLLIVFVCGAVVRFFSSPTFLNFITDALAPKAW